MNDKEWLIKELIVKDFNEILVNEFCTDWKEKRLYIELLVRATHFDYLLNYIQQKENIIKGLDNTIENLEEVVEHKENIIKEAIEYIEENSKSYSLPQTIKDMRYIDFYKLLEILDKKENRKENRLC